MKRKIFLLPLFLFLLTGCSILKLDSNDFSINIDNMMSQKVNLCNIYENGYKYYLPKGIVFITKEDYNAIVSDFKNNRYYLYVDVISYYHKIENNYKENSDSYYSKKLEYRKKNGYLQIDKINSKYYVQFVFNYAKMEAYVSKEDLVDVITNMCSILRTIRFNDVILESLVGENILNYKEEDYTLFKKDSVSYENFLDVVKKEETDRYKKDLEDEKLELDY